jgi:hypothetical protein
VSCFFLVLVHVLVVERAFPPPRDEAVVSKGNIVMHT